MDFVVRSNYPQVQELFLGKELEKKEIQEGLIKACDVIDLIIEILRAARAVTRLKSVW